MKNLNLRPYAQQVHPNSKEQAAYTKMHFAVTGDNFSQLALDFIDKYGHQNTFSDFLQYEEERGMVVIIPFPKWTNLVLENLSGLKIGSMEAQVASRNYGINVQCKFDSDLESAFCNREYGSAIKIGVYFSIDKFASLPSLSKASAEKDYALCRIDFYEHDLICAVYQDEEAALEHVEGSSELAYSLNLS